MEPSRRKFLQIAGLAGVGAAALGLAGCGVAAPPAATHGTNTHETAGAAGSGTPPWQEMDQMHAEGVKAFPAKTAGKGNQPLDYQLDGDVKVFELTCKKVQWEVAPGKTVEAYTYNGMVPGPIIRVTQGDRVRVIVKNELDESTAVHWHGILLENRMDGVSFITQDPIPPGGTFVYEFTARNAGSHMYHSHHNSAIQVARGMLGAFIIDPQDPAERNRYGEDLDYVMILNDGVMGYTLNGKGFPATEPINVKRGQRIRIRFMNEGVSAHPMHLHGLTFEVVERDGYPLPMPFKCDTLTVNPAERWDVIVQADNPGVWAFHCHILPHAESEHGMHGMFTVMNVT